MKSMFTQNCSERRNEGKGERERIKTEIKMKREEKKKTYERRAGEGARRIRKSRWMKSPRVDDNGSSIKSSRKSMENGKSGKKKKLELACSVKWTLRVIMSGGVNK